MIITFYTNYYNHHQAELIKYLSNNSGFDFYLVETEKLSEERRQMGYKDSLSLKSNIIYAYKSKNDKG